MGSVKDVIIGEKPEQNRMGKGNFVFSDRYSVFDYGEMPDQIEGKGKSLCMISAYFFERLDEAGIKNHYIGLVENGEVKKVKEVQEPVNVIQTEIVRILKPERVNGYDYGIFGKEKSNFLIPLEVIYRNTLPEGSSVFRRLERGEITVEQLGLKEYPEAGVVLKEPFLDVSTKLEDKDRYLTWDEAKKISGLDEEEIELLKEITLKVNRIITENTEKAKIRNEDGKLEFAFDDKREMMVVDTIGTPDECRFSFEGIQISKEVLRKYYRRTEWYRRIEKLKGNERWREEAGKPPKLNTEIRNAVSDMYKACCNEITGIRFFDVDSLRNVVREIRDFLGD